MKVKLKNDMLKEKNFLEKLLNNNKNNIRHILNFASLKQLKLVFKIIYLIVKGDIPIPKSNFEILKKKKKLSLLKNLFSEKTVINKLKQITRENLLKTLYKIQISIPYLIKGLF